MHIMEQLQAPFDPDDIEWRFAQAGYKNSKPWAKCLAYIDARAVQDRLDEVVGPECWKDEYSHVTGGVMCKLSLKINNEWITKENGANETDIEAFKGSISKSLVRAASTWGIGRYLYRLKDNWAVFSVNGSRSSQIKDKDTNKQDWHKWDPPSLPEWALPKSLTKNAPQRGENKEQEPSLNDPMTIAQQTRVIAISKKNGWLSKDVNDYAKTRYNVEKWEDVAFRNHDFLCNYILNNPKAKV